MINKNYVRSCMRWACKNNLDLNTVPVSRHIKQMVGGEKFVMPDGGLIFDAGVDMAALLDIPEKYNLPYENIVVEYYMPDTGVDAHDFAPEVSTRRIVLARDLGDKIAMSSVWYVDRIGGWDFGAWLAFSKKDPGIGWHPIVDYWNVFLKKNKTQEQMVYDIAIEGAILLQLLGALSCNNISVGRPAKDTKKVKRGALPFDEYRRLMVSTKCHVSQSIASSSSDRRQSREHLRRGHIRRLNKGAIWINSTVVNAGVGGKIQKEYAIC